MNEAERWRFILSNTAVHPVPHAPEIRLYVADEAVALWQRTEEELHESGIEPPFWAFAWAGGQGIARWVLNNRDEVTDRRVVDFASGSGLVAIAAAMANAERVECCEIDPMGGTAIALNAELNGVGPFTVTSRDVIGQSRRELGDPDLVLVGDIHYDRSFAEAATPWLEALAVQGARVLIGDPGRAYFPRGRGWKRLAEYRVTTMRALEDAEVRAVGVFEVTPRE